jgi:uncharacterized protein (DUF885 family)
MTVPEQSESRAFRAFLETDWKKWLSEYPELATNFGFPGFDDRWTDDSPEGIDGRTRHLRTSVEELRRINPEGLSTRERVSYDLYEGILGTAERGLAFGLDPLPFCLGMPHSLRMPINQMEGIHITASDTIEVQPRDRAVECERIVSRLRLLDPAVRQNISLLEAGRAQGFTPYTVAVRGLPDQVRGLIPKNPLESPFLHAFAEFSPRIEERDRPRLRDAAVAAYTEKVVPAFERLHEYLVSTYLPACRDAPGVSALPEGPALYDHLIALQTTTTLTAQQVHEIGLREVRRLRAAMEALMSSTGFRGSFQEFLNFLRTDERFFFPTEEGLLDGYRVIAKKIDPGLAHLFGRLPRLPYGVLPIPPYRARSSPAAYYMPGAPTTGRPGIFYANTYDLRSRLRWEMEALCLHEAVPGHHLQIALAQEIEDLPAFRRFTGPTAFVEGWGLYAESLGSELGTFRDPYSKMGEYVYDMWRSIRLVVDTGIHALGWSREDAIRFFRENTGKSEIDIAVEVDRYIVWPGQALAYKIGQLKYRELRSLAERTLGDRFDPRPFHDRILEEGALPLDMVDARVRGWLGAVSSSSADPPPGGPGAGREGVPDGV